MSRPVYTRPAHAADEALLLELFAASRPELAMLPLPRDQLRALLRMQLELQRRDYGQRYPDAEQHILEVDDVPVGQLRVARRGDEMVLVDISLLPTSRCQGHGTRLLCALIAEARRTRVPLRLSVRADSPARRLYTRLGFRDVAATATDIAMVLPAPAAGAQAPAHDV